MSINAANIAKYSRASVAPVMYDLATGDFTVKVDRAGIGKGFIEARGQSASDLHTKVKEHIEALKAANVAAAEAAKAAADSAAAQKAALAQSTLEAQQRKQQVALMQKEIDAKAALQKTQLRTGQGGETKTSFLGRSLANIKTKQEAAAGKLSSQVQTIGSNITTTEAARVKAEAEAKAAKDLADAKALAAKTAAAAVPAVPRKKLFGLFGGSRRRRSTRRRSTRRH